jgi:hypothetical protein
MTVNNRLHDTAHRHDWLTACLVIHFSAAIALTISDQATAAPLDPGAFTSLGTLDVSMGTLVFDTDTLMVSGDFAGVGVLQSQGTGLPDVAVFTFDTVTIAGSVAIMLTGSRPIAILSKGDAMIDNVIIADGGMPNSSMGGTGRLGGGAGGNGQTDAGDPQNGVGTGGGGTGTFSDPGGGGGGGALGGNGGDGGLGSAYPLPPPGGTAYGNLLAALEGGSGGGGGTKEGVFSQNAGGGGAGGGAVEIGALGSVFVGGIQARGAPGANGRDNSAGGGGGSGGAVLLSGGFVTVLGGILVPGGDGGSSVTGWDSGGGGGGRVLVQTEILSLATIPAALVDGGQRGVGGDLIVNGLGTGGESGTAHLKPITTIVPVGRVVQIEPSGILSDDTAGAPWTLQTDRLRFDTGSVGVALGSVSSGHDVQLNGGIVTAGFGWTMSGSAQLSGYGTLVGALSGGAANTIDASGGTLVLGDANGASGFDFGGAITIADGAVLNLLDSNGAALQPGGTLTAAGNARIDGTFTNQGTVNGPSTPGEFLTFTDDVDGAGDYTGNILFSDGFNPGNSAAAVSMENVTFDATSALRMEIGGLAAGTEYDQLLISGTATLAGVLDVVIDPLFAPQPGDSFTILTYGSRTGEFTTVNGAGLISSDTFLSLVYDTGELRLEAFVPGDGNFDGWVDGLDYLIWAGNFGDDPADDPPGSPGNGDFDDDGNVDGLDYLLWAGNFGQHNATAVPEPGTWGLLLWGLTTLAARRRRRSAQELRV